MPIGPIPTEVALQTLQTSAFGTELASAKEAAPGLPFADLLKDAIASANTREAVATLATSAFAAGASDDIHGTMIASKEAEIELKLVANVRSKLVDAFNDLWRMSI